MYCYILEAEIKSYELGFMKLTKPFDFSFPFHKSSLTKQSEIPKKKKKRKKEIFKDAPYRVLPREHTSHSKDPLQ